MPNREVQSESSEVVVKVTSGTHRDTGETTTDFIIADKVEGEHHHVVISESGETLYHGVKSDDKKG